MLTIQCPSCERRLRLAEELLARSLQCPGCGVVFTTEQRQTVGLRSDRLPETSIRADGHSGPDDPPLQFLVRPEPRMKWTIRRVFALIGFLIAPLLLFPLVIRDMVVAGLPIDVSSLAAVLAGVVLIAPFLAAVGAAIGRVAEIVLRLAFRRRNESVLLALAGDDEPWHPDVREDAIEPAHEARSEPGLRSTTDIKSAADYEGYRTS